MNQSSSFVRKVIYIAMVGGLLIPLSLVSRPATRDRSNVIKDGGGVLSSLRDKHELSQARLSEIDPGSETMKLASLGLRGLAVNLLWMKAIDAKEKKEWDTFSSTLSSLVKIQPNFIRVWEYQAHNLSYNVSVEFDDYEQRYRWVKKGIEFLTTGIPYNRRDHRVIDSLGFFCGNKIGTADEKVQFRSLFRKDNIFHEEMSKFVNIDKINTAYGPDHWLLAYEWYDRSVRMVELGVEGKRCVRHRKEMLFYQFKPAQKRNMGLALQQEFRPDEYLRNLWGEAHDEWLEYGNRPLTAIEQVEVSLETLMKSSVQVQKLRQRLDAIVPGARNQLLSQRLTQIPVEDRELLSRPVDMLTDEEFIRLRRVNIELYGGDSGVDVQIAQMAPEDRNEEVSAIMKPLLEETIKIRMGDYFRTVTNYEHWKHQTLAEATNKGIAARQAQFDAMELRGQSIFDTYVKRDPISGEETTMPGSLQKFDEAFAIWADIMKDVPQLRLGPMFDDITFIIEKYRVVRQAAGEDSWPDDFVLQPVIDYRAEVPQTYDELPTSEDVRQRLEDRNSRSTLYRLPDRPNIDFQLQSDDAEE